LAARFGVNRHTVRRAVAELQSKGLVRIEQGRGTFVAHDIIDYTLSAHTRYSDNIRRNRLKPGGRLLKAETIVAPERVASALRLRRGVHALHLELLRTASGLPVGVTSTFFDAERFAGLIEAVEAEGAITPAMARFGAADYRRVETRITAHLAGRHDGRLLEIAETAPVLVTEGLDADPNGRPSQFSLARFAAERVHLTVES